MSNVLAGIGRGQLKVLHERVNQRRAIFERYTASLSVIPAIEWMPEATYGCSTHWLSVMKINPELSLLTPSQLISALAAEKIEARPAWKPMHLQPLFRGCAYYAHEENDSISDQIFEQGICLPSGSNLAVENQERVIRVIRKFFEF